LLDVQDQMEGRWNDAPESLLRGLAKLEGYVSHALGREFRVEDPFVGLRTLREMQEYMQALAEARWKDRLFGKRGIEDDLKNYGIMLEDAARTFQVCDPVHVCYLSSWLMLADFLFDRHPIHATSGDLSLQWVYRRGRYTCRFPNWLYL
jgi:hypothetical protein